MAGGELRLGMTATYMGERNQADSRRVKENLSHYMAANNGMHHDLSMAYAKMAAKFGLKGLKARPVIKPSGMEDATAPKRRGKRATPPPRQGDAAGGG